MSEATTLLRKWLDMFEGGLASGPLSQLRNETRILLEQPAGEAPVVALAPLPQQLPPTVTRLPLSTCYSPAQALQAAMHDAEQLENLIVIGQYIPHNGKSPFFCVPSRMDLKNALWVHRRLGFYIDENA